MDFLAIVAPSRILQPEKMPAWRWAVQLVRLSEGAVEDATRSIGLPSQGPSPV
jgi:hypothetical protein